MMLSEAMTVTLLAESYQADDAQADGNSEVNRQNSGRGGRAAVHVTESTCRRRKGRTSVPIDCFRLLCGVRSGYLNIIDV